MYTLLPMFVILSLSLLTNTTEYNLFVNSTFCYELFKFSVLLHCNTFVDDKSRWIVSRDEYFATGIRSDQLQTAQIWKPFRNPFDTELRLSPTWVTKKKKNLEKNPSSSSRARHSCVEPFCELRYIITHCKHSAKRNIPEVLVSCSEVPN